jgi:large subunit ribosomal protein L21
MYAVIEDRGRQYQAAPGDRLTLDRMDQEVGTTVDVAVLLVSDGAQVEVGAPRLEGKKAVLKVLSHTRGKKGIAGTFKRRKDSRRRVGFRHDHTVVEVVSVG